MEMFDDSTDIEIKSIDFGIELSKQNNYTSYLIKDNKKKYIMSKYNPVKTIEDLLERTTYNKETIFIIIGYNFGYIIDQLIEKIGEKISCLIIEPNKEFLEQQFIYKSNQEYEKYKNVQVIHGEKNNLKKSIENKINFNSIYNTQIIISPTYEEMYPIFIKDTLLLIKEIRDAKILHQSTDKNLSKFFMKNIIHNIPYIAKSRNIEQHKGKYKDIPAVIVSAGPSLDKNIHLIKEFKGIVFTGGRSLSAVCAQGREPEFLVSVDASDLSYDTFKDNKINNRPLITALQVNPKVTDSNKGPQYFLNIPDISEELLGVKIPTLPVSGSVASLCLSAAYYMGCNPIIFIGQDMAFTGQKLHADNCTIDNEADSINKYEGTKMIKEYYGGTVLSRIDYIGFLRWFEAFIRSYSDIQYINATEGGAYIEGALHISFQEAIERYNPVHKVNILHNEDVLGNEEQIKTYVRNEVRKLKEDLGFAQEGYKLAKELFDEYNTYKGENVYKIIELNNQLQRIESKFINNKKKEHLVGYLFDHMYKELTMCNEFKEKINESNLDKDTRIVSFNFEIYKRLVEALKEMIEVIDKNLT